MEQNKSLALSESGFELNDGGFELKGACRERQIEGPELRTQRPSRRNSLYEVL